MLGAEGLMTLGRYVSICVCMYGNEGEVGAGGLIALGSYVCMCV